MLTAPFTRDEALAMWARLVAGHAHHLDDTGARTLLDGVTLPALPDAGGSFEGVTRMLFGWGGWLSQPTRSPVVEWRGEQFDIAALMRRAVLAGCDPASRGYWGKPPINPGYDQRTVEAGNIMFNLWQARTFTWDQFSPAEREMVVAFHERFGQRPSSGEWRNNWALFWMLNHAARRALGARHDPALIADVLERWLDQVYCGDGWYDDASVCGHQHFDDYNFWVFGYHVLAWAGMDPASDPARRTELLERVRALMAHYPYLFAADGNYTHYGRSQIYKFARLGAPLIAYKLGVWPHSAGMLRRLVGRHLRWYFDRGAVNANGVLIQPLTGQGSEEIRDVYNATGSAYWAMQAFGALWSLSDDDPFWTAREEQLPVEQGDFARVFPQPGWVVVGTQATGQVQRFIAGSPHGPADPAKYDKYVYATAAPFNCGYVHGTPAPDAMLALTDGDDYGHRRGNLRFAVGEPGWLRMRYTQTIGGGTHQIDTTIITLGETHLRAHRITLDPAARGPLGAVEGGAALGYSPGAIPAVFRDRTTNVAVARLGHAVAIAAVRGYDRPRVTSAWQGRSDLNSVFRLYVLPMLLVERLRPEHELICLVHIGQSDVTPSLALAEQISSAEWRDDAFDVAWKDGRTLSVPPL